MLEDDDQDQLQQQQGQGAVPVLEENPTPADYNQAMNISRKMYLGGFAFLPWLWLINFIGFRNVLKDQNAPEEFKLYVKRSLYFCIGFAVIWIIWLIVYYTNLDSDWANSITV